MSGTKKVAKENIVASRKNGAVVGFAIMFAIGTILLGIGLTFTFRFLVADKEITETGGAAAIALIVLIPMLIASIGVSIIGLPLFAVGLAFIIVFARVPNPVIRLKNENVIFPKFTCTRAEARALEVNASRSKLYVDYGGKTYKIPFVADAQGVVERLSNLPDYIAPQVQEQPSQVPAAEQESAE